jgi:DNA invertase Pin-like site-specific DNA recombinase
MNELLYSPKIKPQHLARKAIVYLRQSSEKQVRQNLESQRLQYELAERIRSLGWQDIEVINSDLGRSAGLGAAVREGFERVLSAVALGEVGIVVSREVSRLSRTDKDWCRLAEVCQIFGTLIGDEQQVYDLSYLDDQLVLGIKGTLSVVELKVLRQRLLAGQESKHDAVSYSNDSRWDMPKMGLGRWVCIPINEFAKQSGLCLPSSANCGACGRRFNGFVITMWSCLPIRSAALGWCGRSQPKASWPIFYAILFMRVHTCGEGVLWKRR